jgi:hypothetical protein
MNRSEYGANVGKVTPDQPELPAWLQSLRAGTQPTYATGGNTNFSASDLVEEGALPGWMQPGQPDAANSLTGPHAALRSSSMPAPNTDGGVSPAGSMSASSLIDEQALPSWMREQPNAQAQQGVAASSLVQPDALPPWLREEQVQPQRQQSLQPQVPVQPQTPPIMSISPSPSWPGAPQGQPVSSVPSGQSFQAQSAQAALQTGAQAQVPQSQVQQPQSVFPSQGLSAQDLVDPQSLPPWLSAQSGAPTNGAGLSAASLLDMNALPRWLRENGQGSQPVQMNMNGAVIPPSAPMQPIQTQQPQGRPAPAGNLAAASFVDMNALPDWLRSNGDGQPGGAMPNVANQSRQGTYGGVPPRVENVRVPGRPRGVAGPQEESSVAANVFASMLGVASNAPYLPGQPQQGPGPQMQTPLQPSQAMPPVSGTLSGQGQAPGQGIMPSGPGAQAYPGPMQGYGSQGYQAGPQGQPGQQGGYQMGSQLGVSQPLPNQGMPGPAGHPMQPGQLGQAAQSAQAKSSKSSRRGFLDTIREWFGLNT